MFLVSYFQWSTGLSNVGVITIGLFTFESVDYISLGTFVRSVLGVYQFLSEG